MLVCALSKCMAKKLPQEIQLPRGNWLPLKHRNSHLKIYMTYIKVNTKQIQFPMVWKISHCTINSTHNMFYNCHSFQNLYIF